MTPALRATWESLPDGCAALAYHGGAALTRVVPASLARGTGRAFGLLCWALQPERRNTLHNNLRGVVKKSSQQKVSRWARRAFAGFGESVVDTLRLAHLEPHELLHKVEFSNLSCLGTRDQPTGAVLLSLHTANWEWIGAALCTRGYKVSAVARAHSPRVEGFFRRMRDRFGVRTQDRFWLDDCPEETHLLALFCDRRANHPRLRRLERTARAAASLAARRSWKLVPTWIEPTPGHGYRVVFGRALVPGRDREQRLECARSAVAFLQSRLAGRPDGWFAFQDIPTST